MLRYNAKQITENFLINCNLFYMLSNFQGKHNFNKLRRIQTSFVFLCRLWTIVLISFANAIHLQFNGNKLITWLDNLTNY